MYLCEVPRKLDAIEVMPGADFLEPVLLELYNLKAEVCPEAVLVKFDSAGQPLHLHQLHVVHQGVAVLPRLLARARQRLGRHNLVGEEWEKASKNYSSWSCGC